MSPLSFLNASIRHARESTYAKASLGTVPDVPVASVNRNRVVVKEFRSTLRAACHESILGCYQAYNRKGGCIVPMQSGSSLYFPRACILAIYADSPAATKCTLTGSACPQCFTPRRRMANTVGNVLKMRTDENMHVEQQLLRNYRDRRGQAGASARAKSLGRRLGVQLDYLSPWSNREARLASPSDWVFGPDPKLDNVYQCMPQVTLHGFDEGLVQKLNYGTVMTFIAHGAAVEGMNTTAVSVLYVTPLQHFLHIYNGTKNIYVT